VRAKKATSEPETSAEMQSRIEVPTNINATSKEKPKYVIPKPSKSYFYRLNSKEREIATRFSLFEQPLT
jgi:hypothetical protein